MIVALSAQAEPRAVSSSERAWSAVLIGAVGLALAGGYAAGAVATGDNPSAVPLAITGGVLSSGLLTAGFGFAIHPPKDALDAVVTVIFTVVAAVLGGVVAGYFSQQPGAARTATHGVIIGFLVLDTLAIELANLGR